MDKIVSVRFYEIEYPNDGSPRFEELLRNVAALPKRDREASLDEGAVVLRLEDLTEDHGVFFGDLTRVQTHNLPSHVLDDDVAKLPVDEIGHSAVFLYDTQTNCLAMQFNVQMGVGRLCRYLRQFGDGADFGRMPYLKKDTLDRFKHQTPTKLHLKVARVRNFRKVESGKTEFEDQIEEWSDLFEAPSVEVVFTTRGEGKHLNSASVWNTIRRWIRFDSQIEGIKKISAETLESDKAFDFIKDLLNESRTLDMPDKDPHESRVIRASYVRQMYERHRDYIRSVSGVP